MLCSNIYLCTVKYYWSTRWAQGAFQSGHASTHTSVLTPLPAIPPHTGRPSTTPTPLAILPHIAMQLVLIDILSFPPCPLPFTDIYDIRYQYIDWYYLIKILVCFLAFFSQWSFPLLFLLFFVFLLHFFLQCLLLPPEYNIYMPCLPASTDYEWFTILKTVQNIDFKRFISKIYMNWKSLFLNQKEIVTSRLWILMVGCTILRIQLLVSCETFEIKSQILFEILQMKQ